MKKLFKFHISVAVDARIWGNSSHVTVHKLVYYLPFEIIRKIKNVIRNAQFVGYAFSILHIVQRAAGVGAWYPCIFIVIELHGAADAVKAPILYKLSGDAGINAAAHCNKCFHFFTLCRPDD